MSFQHKVKCDYCGLVADTTYNGEHHIPPKGWFELTSCETVQSNGQHVCPECMPSKVIKKVRKSTK